MNSAGRSWTAACAWMIVCSLTFEVLYNACNWITARRSDVGSCCFGWELRIPFVPAMIVPYWSLDLFFVAAFFVCGNPTELGILGRRIVLAVLVACACFLMFPLRLVFPRPQVTGLFGLLFTALRGFDMPFNLSPSLHVALRTLLWPVYIPRTTGLPNLLLRVWFLLIGVSTVFTYQHQVIDVVTGWILAVVCLYAIAERDPATDTTRRVRNGCVGCYYAFGAAGFLALSIGVWPWGAILLWPACALGLVAAGYFWLGPIVYRKFRGRLPFSTRVLLAPVLLGHYVSLLYYRRQCNAWAEVSPGVLIGRRLSEAEAAKAIGAGVTAVLDLTTEFSEARPFLSVRYRNLPLLDLTAPTASQLREAAQFIADESRSGQVYAHCKIGYSRSAAAIGAYLLESGLATTVDNALEMLRSVRPSIIVRPEALRALRDYQEMLESRSLSATTT